MVAEQRHDLLKVQRNLAPGDSAEGFLETAGRLEWISAMKHVLQRGGIQTADDLPDAFCEGFRGGDLRQEEQQYRQGDKERI